MQRGRRAGARRRPAGGALRGVGAPADGPPATSSTSMPDAGRDRRVADGPFARPGTEASLRAVAARPPTRLSAGERHHAAISGSSSRQRFARSLKASSITRRTRADASQNLTGRSSALRAAPRRRERSCCRAGCRRSPAAASRVGALTRPSRSAARIHGESEPLLASSQGSIGVSRAIGVFRSRISIVSPFRTSRGTCSGCCATCPHWRSS